ncbi:MAG: hypothetical protein KJ621_21120 [Proteobacteria bacterium]|nr:hypothetical protein [Pseudomonadota bacterium]
MIEIKKTTEEEKESKTSILEITHDVILKEFYFIDNIFEIEPMIFTIHDLLEVIYNITVVGRINVANIERTTSRLPVKFNFRFDGKKFFDDKKDIMIIKWIRFTKIEENARIQIYEKRPEIVFVEGDKKDMFFISYMKEFTARKMQQ